MVKRKKRLEKGIDSIGEQIEIHKEKERKAEENDLPELVNYYKKEIAAKEEDIRKKKKLLDKQ
jgi:peptidoglycan hydrolase CwlO-like protein